MAKCNSRIIYNKINNSFVLDKPHSEFCEIRNKESFNLQTDINAEVNNYKKFKDELIAYLDNNPIIKYKNFKLKSIKLYYKNNCQFKITKNTFKNIYYNWRCKSPLFTKFSIFKNTRAKNDKLYLRDYRYCVIYKTNGKKIFNHEHIIQIILLKN